jgi:large subunit ribosomal protein L15
MAEDLRLHTLKPAQARKDRKRVGRGLGSGKGRYSGRGIKGQKSRAGSHKMPAEFEGGQTRIFMRLPKLRGNTSKDAMPIGPFRTTTVPVNVAALDAFDDGAEVTPELLVEKGLIKNTRTDVKLLGQGELKKKLTVRVHAISASAREKVEAAGGSVSLLKEPKVKKQARSARPQSGPGEGARGNREVPPEEPEAVEEPASEEA